MAVRYKKGRPDEMRDTMIAGIVLASHAKLATRNTSHFEDLSVPVVNHGPAEPLMRGLNAALLPWERQECSLRKWRGATRLELATSAVTAHGFNVLSTT